MGIAQAFIPAIIFPLFNCDLSDFFALLMYLLFTFSFISLFIMESICNTPKYLYLLTSVIHFPSDNSIPSVQTIFPLFKTSTAHFSRPKPIPKSSEKILMVWISESNSHLLFAYSFKLSRNKRWLNFWFRLVTYRRSVSFKIINRGIRTTTKNKGEKESPWKIPLLISTSSSISLHTISSVLHVYLLFSNTLMMLCDSNHFHSLNHPTMQHHVIGLFVINPSHFEITLVLLTVLQNLIIHQELVLHSLWVFPTSLLLIW